MKITIELPNTVKDCKHHAFDVHTGLCECGLPMALSEYLEKE